MEVTPGSSWGRGRKITCFGVTKYLAWVVVVVVEVRIPLYHHELMLLMMEGYVRNHAQTSAPQTVWWCWLCSDLFGGSSRCGLLKRQQKWLLEKKATTICSSKIVRKWRPCCREWNKCGSKEATAWWSSIAWVEVEFDQAAVVDVVVVATWWSAAVEVVTRRGSNTGLWNNDDCSCCGS